MEDFRLRYRKYRMYEIVKQYILSNQSREDFCREKNLSNSKLQYWYRQYRKEEKGEDLFVQMRVDETPVAAPVDELKIRLPNGTVIEIQTSDIGKIVQSLMSES